MNKFTLLHDPITTNKNQFILYSTRSNGTYFFVASATVLKIKNNLFQISRLNTRKGYSDTFLKALFQFFSRIDCFLSFSSSLPTKMTLKENLQRLFSDKGVSKIKTPQESRLSSKYTCLEYGYKTGTINNNIVFSSDQQQVKKKMSDWRYFSALFPSDAHSEIELLEPIFQRPI